MAEDPTSRKTSDSSEDTRRYWEHLDAKFATFSRPSAPARAPAPEEEPAPEPDPVREPEPLTPDLVTAAAHLEPVPVAERHPGAGLIAEAFIALLAYDDGQPGARPVRLTSDEQTAPAADTAPAPVEPTITDAIIEDVVRRVIERLAPDTVRAVVADIVSETAERLVKDEIDRIRNQHA